MKTRRSPLKRKYLLLIGFFLIFMATAVSSCRPVPAEPDWTRTLGADWLSGVSKSESACLAFMSDQMINTDGGIRTNYTDKSKSELLASGSEVLAESQGLMMHYALLKKDRLLFDQSLGYVNDALVENDIIAYRFSDESGAYAVNAAVDDLRIIHALLLADDAFNTDAYGALALKYANMLYKTNIFDSKYLTDFYDVGCQISGDSITLCYADLETLNLLKAKDARWGRVTRAMTDIVAHGYISDGFPLYATSYSYADQSYHTDTIRMVEAGLTVLNLARIHQCPETTHRFLKQLVLHGAVYGAYYSDGTPASTVESTAVYAILAQIAVTLNDVEMYQACIDRMKSLQVLDETSAVFGAFANPETLDLYAFDNLNALLALDGGYHD